MIKSLRRNEKLEDRQKMHIVRRITAVLAIVAVLIVIGGYGLKTTSLIAIMGVAGLALSLAAQGLLSDFFSGCILAITRPFSEVDVIDICGKTGVVEHIGYLNTTIVTIDNITVIVPNTSLTSGSIVNYSARETLWLEKTFVVAAGMPDENVRKAFLEAFGRDSRILTDPEPAIHLESFDSMNATYVVCVPCKSGDYYNVSYAIVENVRATFVEHAIEMGTEMFGMRSMGRNGGFGGDAQQGGGAGGSRGAGGRQGGGADGGPGE